MDKLKKFGWYLLLTILTLPAVWNLLRPGFFPMQDDLQAFRIQQMDKCFDDGQIPCRWVPDAGYAYGYPQFIYYPPSVYYVGAILHRIGFQYIDAVKILFVAGYFASAFAMFLLIDKLFGSFPALIASIIYTYVPYKAVEVYVRGAMSEFWSLTLFPLIFWAIYMYIKNQKNKYFVLFSVFVGLLLTTHNLMSLIFAPVTVVWALYWMYSENKFNLIWKVGLSGLLGLGLASFFTLPVIFEKSFVHVDSMLSGYFDYRAHFVSLYKLFLSREWGYGSSGFPDELLNLSVGLVQWIFGFGVVGFSIFKLLKSKKIKNKKDNNLYLLSLVLGILVLSSLFMIHMKSSFVWKLLPMLWWMQFPWRFLSVSIFLFSVLAGVGVYLLGKKNYIFGLFIALIAILLNVSYFVPKDWLNITDNDKFSGVSWQKQMTISIFDYLPMSAELPPINEAPKVPEMLDGKAEIVSYTKGSNFQYGKIKVTETATIRIPLFDFPGMQLKVNGEKKEYINNDCRKQKFCYGLITFKLEKGEYNVEVRLTDTPIRRISSHISLISMVIVLVLIVYERKNNK